MMGIKFYIISYPVWALRLFKRGILGAQKFNFLQKWPNLQGRLDWRSFFAWITFFLWDSYFLRYDRFCIFFTGLDRYLKKKIFSTKRSSLRSLLSNLKYNIDTNSKTKNCTKKKFMITIDIIN